MQSVSPNTVSNAGAIHYCIRRGQNDRTLSLEDGCMRLRMLAATLLALTAAVQADEEFNLQSPDVGPDKEFSQEFAYNAFGCTGGNQSFALSWSSPPPGTQSFAVTTYDPDAIAGKGFWHWFVINIPATVTSLPRDAGNRDNSNIPPGARQLKSSFNKIGYGGSCPRRGDKPHNYVVTVYALKTRKLDIPADALPNEALPIVEANALGKATLTYKYGR
jgi:Raf kinase inhibitor-like YbhB/YbcL family protein